MSFLAYPYPSRLGTYYISDSAFCTGFSRLEVPEQALDAISHKV